jgi:hypothetical protein
VHDALQPGPVRLTAYGGLVEQFEELPALFREFVAPHPARPGRLDGACDVFFGNKKLRANPAR